jgi:hypothetical protein
MERGQNQFRAGYHRAKPHVTNICQRRGVVVVKSVIPVAVAAWGLSSGWHRLRLACRAMFIVFHKFLELSFDRSTTNVAQID